MPTIEERALEKLNEVRKEWSAGLLGNAYTRLSNPTIEAFCREIETLDAERAAHVAFRQEVSDVARDAVAMLDEMAKPLLMGRNVKERLEKARSGLEPLILPKPVDPLVEAVRDCGYATLDAIEPEFVADLRAALAKRGLKLVEVGDAD